MFTRNGEIGTKWGEVRDSFTTYHSSSSGILVRCYTHHTESVCKGFVLRVGLEGRKWGGGGGGGGKNTIHPPRECSSVVDPYNQCDMPCCTRHR